MPSSPDETRSLSAEASEALSPTLCRPLSAPLRTRRATGTASGAALIPPASRVSRCVRVGEAARARSSLILTLFSSSSAVRVLPCEERHSGSRLGNGGIRELSCTRARSLPSLPPTEPIPRPHAPLILRAAIAPPRVASSRRLLAAGDPPASETGNAEPRSKASPPPCEEEMRVAADLRTLTRVFLRPPLPAAAGIRDELSGDDGAGGGRPCRRLASSCCIQNSRPPGPVSPPELESESPLCRRVPHRPSSSRGIARSASSVAERIRPASRPLKKTMSKDREVI